MQPSDGCWAPSSAGARRPSACARAPHKCIERGCRWGVSSAAGSCTPRVCRGSVFLLLCAALADCLGRAAARRGPREDSIYDEYRVDPLDKASDAAYDYAADEVHEFSGARTCVWRVTAAVMSHACRESLPYCHHCAVGARHHGACATRTACGRETPWPSDVQCPLGTG